MIKNVKQCFLKFVAIAYIVTCGCSLLKASARPASGFLPNENLLVEQRDRAPFNGSYFPDINRLERLRTIYRKVYVAPIEIRELATKLDKRISMSKFQLTNQLEALSGLKMYFEERIKQEFAKVGFTVLNTPEEEAFMWELAIVELEATGVVVNFTGSILGVFFPGGGLIRRLGVGSIAIEGLVRDSTTGDILAQFKDREKDKESVFTLRDFQQYSHARVTMDEWAEQFAKLATTPCGTKVEDSIPITLLPF